LLSVVEREGRYEVVKGLAAPSLHARASEVIRQRRAREVALDDLQVLAEPVERAQVPLPASSHSNEPETKGAAMRIIGLDIHPSLWELT
jgi:hypothetical protein